MDVNEDGCIDLLSGSYSRTGAESMAGLFQVLYGKKDGTFKLPEALHGTDGQPLIIPADDEDGVIRKICTRPTAVDLNGDGHLDVVSGNFEGSFYVFPGQGKGRFAPEGRFLESAGKRMMVAAHSDPFFVDWDGDGDQDLISGSDAGHVDLFRNEGTSKEPKFAAALRLLKGPEHGHGIPDTDEVQFGPDWIKRPQGSVRVFATDVNRDGKLDLLLGDSLVLHLPVEGVGEDQARAAMRKFDAAIEKLFDTGSDGELPEDFNERYTALMEERDKVVQELSTGFVWVMYQK